jgi:hypothetical protein
MENGAPIGRDANDICEEKTTEPPIATPTTPPGDLYI